MFPPGSGARSASRRRFLTHGVTPAEPRVTQSRLCRIGTIPTAAAERGLRAAGHEVDAIDLHEDGFNPVMSAQDLSAWRTKRAIDPQVQDYRQRVLAADHIIFAFPIWWEAMPALTKGFFDRVHTKGIVYDEPKPGRPFVNKLPRLGGVTLITVMSTPAPIYRWWFGNPLTKIAFRGTFRKIGVRNLIWINHSGVADRSDRQRLDLLRTRFR